jgi:hypothetical protein
MRKYDEDSSHKVEKTMEEMKEGKLYSGRSGKKVTNPRQAIAIGLSEARKEGDKVPSAPKKAATKRTTKRTTKKAAPKKPAKRSHA